MLSEKDKKRYHRQILIPEIGEEGQEKLKKASVLVVGAGGLGCPVLQYLTGAGVGNIGIVDGDLVSFSNLHRQLLFSEEDVDLSKAEAAASKLSKMNSSINFMVNKEFLSEHNIYKVAEGYDVIIGATDNYASRYLIDDYCRQTGKSFIHGSVRGFEGQFSVFHYDCNMGYADLFPETASNPGDIPEIIGVTAGITGMHMAMETIKVVCNLSGTASDGLYILNVLDNSIKKLRY